MTDDENRNAYFLTRATKRLKRDMKLITSDPIPAIDVALDEDDILGWHFVIHGREGTPYQDGVYHGRLVFPPTFPFGPPKILFLTPNGRFKVNERICFSLSDFHPEEWKPAYSVTAVLRGVYDFMHETTDTIGSINTTNSERRRLAGESMEYNKSNASFREFFPQLCIEEMQDTTNEEKMDIDETPFSYEKTGDEMDISTQNSNPRTFNDNHKKTVEVINPIDIRDPSPAPPSMETIFVAGDYSLETRSPNPAPPSMETGNNFLYSGYTSPTPMETTAEGNNLLYTRNLSPTIVEGNNTLDTSDPNLTYTAEGNNLKTRTPSPASPSMETTTVGGDYSLDSIDPSSTTLFDVNNPINTVNPSPSPTPMETTLHVGSILLFTRDPSPTIVEGYSPPDTSNANLTNTVEDNNPLSTRTPSPATPSMETTSVLGSNTIFPSPLPYIERKNFLNTRYAMSDQLYMQSTSAEGNTDLNTRNTMPITILSSNMGITGNILPSEKYFQAPHVGISSMHKSVKIDKNSDVEKAYLPSKVSRLRLGIILRDLRCYSTFFFILTIAYAFMLIYLLAYLTIFK